MSDDAARRSTPDAEVRGFGLFEAYGVEIELMLVDAHSFDVKPACDELLETLAGEPDPRFPARVPGDVERGEITWSNELPLHVVELKTTQPVRSLTGVARRFHESLGAAEPALARLGARLLSGAMHPWMDPARETVLWPHGNQEVYRAFDRIFGCGGHGWANVQSTHVNLPFADDEELARLHSAIRMVLPLIPGLAASSPFQDGAVGGALDGRMQAYATNSLRIPSVAGRVVPEPVMSEEQYQRDILGRIYADLAPLDPEGTLRHDWVNARGAIARFGRRTVEIRVIDAQECPTSDVAVVAAVVGLVRALAEGRLADRDLASDPDTDVLARVLERAVADGERALVDERAILRILGVRKDAVPLGELWARLLDAHPPDDPAREWTSALQIILEQGPLARRMLAAAGPRPDRAALRRVADALCRCAAENASFTDGAA